MGRCTRFFAGLFGEFNQYRTFGNGLACSQILNDQQSALIRKLLAK
jgi:hypothetical protein